MSVGMCEVLREEGIAVITVKGGEVEVEDWGSPRLGMPLWKSKVKPKETAGG